MYQREARTARDKKDKEEIEMLRSEVGHCHGSPAPTLPSHLPQLQELREELQRRESRWSATASRYRLKLETVEARNRELEGDLRLMEQERLQWWQAQVKRVQGLCCVLSTHVFTIALVWSLSY